MDIREAYNFPSITSWDQYKELVRTNEANCSRITEMYGDACPPPGSLSWPGDLQILEKYGVTCTEIFQKLITIITETNAKLKEQIDDAKKSGKLGMFEATCLLNDKFKITVGFQLNEALVKKVNCAYCKEVHLRNAYYEIKNITNSTKVNVPVVMLHLLEKHNDLGDPPGPLCLDVKILCNVLEIGNTSIDEKDPLYRVAECGKRTFEDLVDLESNNFIERPSTGSFMMSSYSGRSGGIATLMLSGTSGRK